MEILELEEGLGGLKMKGWKMRVVNDFCPKYRVLRFGRYTGDCNRERLIIVGGNDVFRKKRGEREREGGTL